MTTEASQYIYRGQSVGEPPSTKHPEVGSISPNPHWNVYASTEMAATAYPVRTSCKMSWRHFYKSWAFINKKGLFRFPSVTGAEQMLLSTRQNMLLLFPWWKFPSQCSLGHILITWPDATIAFTLKTTYSYYTVLKPRVRLFFFWPSQILSLVFSEQSISHKHRIYTITDFPNVSFSENKTKKPQKFSMLHQTLNIC